MRFSLFVFLILATGLARGAPLERDLGRGLTYYRAQNVPADLPAGVSAPNRGCVLDLRYTQGDGAVAVAAWLKTRASARTPVFVLANAATDPRLLALLSRRKPDEGVLVLGAASPGFAPDIMIPVSPEVEHRAYDAFATQTDTNALLTENTSKVRNDEARLAKEHAPGPGGEDSAGNYQLPSAPPEEKAAPPTPPPSSLVDYTLQRALHLHRALLALKKI